MASEKYTAYQEALKKSKLYDELKPKYEELKLYNNKNKRLVVASESITNILSESAGQPRKLLPDDITLTRIADMSMLGATDKEMAGCLRVTETTWMKFKRDFPIVVETIEASKNEGKLRLRRMQWQHAETNPAAAIWLGKNELGQTDKMSTETNINVNVLRSLMDMSDDEELDYIETSSEVLRDDDEE